MAWLAARSCRRGFQRAPGSRAGVGQEQSQLACGHPPGKSRKRESHFGQVRAGRREVVAFRVYGRKGAGGPGRKGLVAVIAEVQKTHPGTVFSITPAIKNHEAVAVILIAQKGKVTTVTQP